MGILPAIQEQYSEDEYIHNVQLLSRYGESQIYPKSSLTCLQLIVDDLTAMFDLLI